MFAGFSRRNKLSNKKRTDLMKLILKSIHLFFYGIYADAVYIYFNKLTAAHIASGRQLTSPLLISLSKKCSCTLIKFNRLEKIFCTEIEKSQGI